MLDPHQQAAVRGALGSYLSSFDSRQQGVTVTLLAALLPGQAGTTLCPCYDQVGQRTTDPSDPRCFGRGVLGGYAPGVVLAVSLIVGQTREVQRAEGYLETQEGAIAYIQEGASVAQPVLK